MLYTCRDHQSLFYCVDRKPAGDDGEAGTSSPTGKARTARVKKPKQEMEGEEGEAASSPAPRKRKGKGGAAVAAASTEVADVSNIDWGPMSEDVMAALQAQYPVMYEGGAACLVVTEYSAPMDISVLEQCPPQQDGLAQASVHNPGDLETLKSAGSALAPVDAKPLQSASKSGRFSLRSKHPLSLKTGGGGGSAGSRSNAGLESTSAAATQVEPTSYSAADTGVKNEDGISHHEDRLMTMEGVCKEKSVTGEAPGGVDNESATLFPGGMSLNHFAAAADSNYDDDYD
jgi:hypothetical protein